jgi:hypothetical protein
MPVDFRGDRATARSPGPTATGWPLIVITGQPVAPPGPTARREDGLGVFPEFLGGLEHPLERTDIAVVLGVPRTVAGAGPEEESAVAAGQGETVGEAVHARDA